MKRKLHIYSYILLFILFNNFQLLNLQTSKNNTNKKLSINKRRIKLTQNSRGEFQNPNLGNDDLIIFYNNILNVTNEFISEFTSPLIGIFST